MLAKLAAMMLAPAVMAMRIPLMAAEMGKTGAWPTESVRAFTEKTLAFNQGIVAAQMSIAAGMFGAWTGMLSGRTHEATKMMEKAGAAALHPMAIAVRANHRRLSRQRY